MREQVYWGWGEPGAGPALPTHADEWLREHFELRPDEVAPPRLPDPAPLPFPALTDPEIRLLRAGGKSYLDLLRHRAGDISAPDGVVQPRDADEVAAVLRICNEEGVAVVPWGGGTSVVGGVAPLRGRFDSVVSLDLGLLTSVEVDGQLARLGPGIRLPEADHALAKHGLRLAHYPQSYEWATVGGCVATRSAGQASTGFGRIEENVVSLTLATPLGELSSREVPASAAGPSLRELIVGSEGAFGVITSVSLRVRPLPDSTHYEAWLLPGFEEGAALLRSFAEREIAPDIARLSDVVETDASLALSGRAGWNRWERCLLVLGWEGETRRRRAVRGDLLRARAVPLGQAGGRAWLKSRFAGPHLRDDLLDRGLLVETLETATTWSRLAELKAGVARALDGLHVGCHISHVYPTGASLYFTCLGTRDREDPLGQWERFKAAACEAIVAHGGALTHHHAVGRDHAPWLAGEHGELGVEVLRAVKERLDPAGIMNPGKLLRVA